MFLRHFFPARDSTKHGGTAVTSTGTISAVMGAGSGWEWLGGDTHSQGLKGQRDSQEAGSEGVLGMEQV